jgi:hypothetical protein
VTGLLFQMTPGRVLNIYIMTFVCALISGAIAVRKVQSTDPAEVFGYELSTDDLNRCAVQIRNLNYYFGRGELRKQVLV